MTITVNEAPKVTVADFSSGAPIAGLRSPATTGDYRQLARLQNHIMQRLGTTAPAIQQWWTDGGNYATAGTGFNTVCSWRIPVLSTLHEHLRCAVYWMPQSGAAPGATVEARFSSVSKGDSITIDGNGTGWRDSTSGGHLELDTGSAYETIELALRGTAAVDPVVYGVCCEYVRPTVSSSFLDTSLRVNYPTHDEECAQGLPLSSDLMRRWVNNTITAEARERVLLNWSANDSVGANSQFSERYIAAWVPHYPDADGMSATVHIRANSISTETYAYISHGNFLLGLPSLSSSGERLRPFVDGEGAPVDCTRVTIPGGSLGDTWVSTSIDLRPTVAPAPPGLRLEPGLPVVDYPGTMLGVFTFGTEPGAQVRSISAWGP